MHMLFRAVVPATFTTGNFPRWIVTPAVQGIRGIIQEVSFVRCGGEVLAEQDAPRESLTLANSGRFPAGPAASQSVGLCLASTDSSSI